MATQGVVSIAIDGKTVIKATVGCNGYNADQLAELIRTSNLEKPEDIERVANQAQFGCSECRVIQAGADATATIFRGDDDLSALYFDRDKFFDPQFNPRWEEGTADHVVVIERRAEQTSGVESESPK